MFVKYHSENFPLIYIEFFNKSPNPEEWDKFLNDWLELYSFKKDFILIFDTRQIEYFPPIEYTMKMIHFMDELKKRKDNYLKKNLILVNNQTIKNILDLIFKIKSPQSPTYIWYTGLTKESINNSLFIENISEQNLASDMIYISPNQSFFK